MFNHAVCLQEVISDHIDFFTVQVIFSPSAPIQDSVTELTRTSLENIFWFAKYRSDN